MELVREVNYQSYCKRVNNRDTIVVPTAQLEHGLHRQRPEIESRCRHSSICAVGQNTDLYVGIFSFPEFHPTYILDVSNSPIHQNSWCPNLTNPPKYFVFQTHASFRSFIPSILPMFQTYLFFQGPLVS